jgi:hypothetical protein
VREDDDGRVAAEAGDVLLDEGQLLGTEVSEVGDVDDVVQGDEVNALQVEARPAGALRARAEGAAAAERSPGRWPR